MPRPLLSSALLAAAVTACAGEPTAVVLTPGSAPLAAKGGGSGSVTRTITMADDIAPLTNAHGSAVTAAVNASAPFKNLTLAGVTVTLNAPTGDPAKCRQPGSTRTYDETSFGGNAGTWTGELVIWQGKTTALSNFKFSGTRSSPTTGAPETVQFTSNDNDAAQTTSPDGTTILTFTSAPLGFGGQSTHFDVDPGGLPVLRCVRLTVAAAP
jgi:hypothetical protein